jgi:peptide/nickel transport system substrate-binding protein
VARGLALAAAIAVSLLAVAGAGGAPEQTPKRGGTLYSLQESWRCPNPLVCDADGYVDQVLEGAFEEGPDLVLRPNLVSAVDVTLKPRFTLTYHIRPEARWSDGVPVTAFEFRFTQEVFEAHGTSFAHQLHDKVRHVQVVDAKTFRIELREPFAQWRSLYRTVLPRHALQGEDVTKVWDDRIDNPRTGRAIGSGPFLTERWQRGVQLTLVRNPRYWGSHTAYLDRIVVRSVRGIPSPEVLELARRGEIDVTLLVTPEEASQARRLPGWRVLGWPPPAAEHLTFRVGPGGHPALRQKLVRQALAFGIDRVAIARAIYADENPVSRRPLDSTTFFPTESSYEAAWAGYRYDPARAQRLLRQAGCRRGSESIFSCAGEPLSLRFVTTAGDTARERTLQLVRAQLRRAGVEVVLTYAPSRVVFGQILPSGEFDAALFSWVSNGGGVTWPDTWCQHPVNFGGYCDRLVQRDLKQADVIVEQRQRARVLNAADRKLARAVPVLPILQGAIWLAVKNTIRGVAPGGVLSHTLQASEDWWLADSR